ncbi:hypothetical protein G7Y89_g3478 [Cudoniella acicularis]|uniref:Major facilitator superfamily (MFS) profile domain-containing protein n=1 Tax=Cudoniella acicularis TaxID=354080 RepID=A0A8H4W5J5_9HELO|nr:hypothetical protein G7Y89_g3478 [Cudoniella acicularis]
MDSQQVQDAESEGNERSNASEVSEADARFPTEQLFFLALCRIAEPVALTSVFPYAYDMMKWFGGDVGENAGFYSGVLMAAFSLAETLTSFMWGALSDRIGRKPVLILGCAGTMLSMLVIGFSPNIYLAILGRAIGGGLNGNIGVVQTMVGELITNPKHEPPLLDGTVEETSYGTDSTAIGPATKNPDLKLSEKLTFKIWNPIIAVCILTSHTLNYIQLLPIFLQTPRDTTVPKYYLGGIGGLGYPLYKTGQVMGIGGIISLGVQSLLFPPCTEYFGVIPTFAVVTVLHPLAYFAVSYLAFIPEGIWRTIALYSWITIRTIFSVFPYPLLLIFVKRATPTDSMLGTVNGIVASSGALFRTFSPPAAGYLQTLGERAISHHEFSPVP